MTVNQVAYWNMLQGQEANRIKAEEVGIRNKALQLEESKIKFEQRLADQKMVLDAIKTGTSIGSDIVKNTTKILLGGQTNAK